MTRQGGESAPTVDPSLPAEAERYRVYLLTVGQGSEVWELFGHNALLIVDNLTGEQLAWNWGLFNFDDDGFLLRFLRGTMRYTMGPFDADRFVNSYEGTDRVVYANEVFLSQEEAAALDAYVRNNYLPENRPYIYQYFRDNCSTRVRDALDSVLGGVLEAEFSGNLTERSYRWHARRLVQIEGWVDQGLSFLLGTRGDRPITEWEAMFAPLELLELLEGVEREDEGGGTRPLLGSRVTLLTSPRSEVPAGPPALSPIWPLLGLLLGATIVAIARSTSQGSRWARSATLAGAAIWGLFSGVLGLLLLLSWLTDHEFIRWNLNLFHLSPIGLLLAAASLTLLLRGGTDATTAGRIARTSSQWIAVGAFLAALLQATPFLAQGNAEVLLLSLPINFAIAWGMRSLFRPAGDGTTPFTA